MALMGEVCCGVLGVDEKEGWLGDEDDGEEAGREEEMVSERERI